MTTSNGVKGLINIKNHNWVAQIIRKVTEMDLDKPRSFQGKIKKTREKAKEHYIKMHSVERQNRPRMTSPGWRSTIKSRKKCRKSPGRKKKQGKQR